MGLIKSFKINIRNRKKFSITFGFDDIGKMRTLNKIILTLKK